MTFDSTIVDESDFTEEGDIVTPGGRLVLDTVANDVRDLGLSVSDPQPHNFYGWTIDVRTSGRHYVLLLQRPESWLLTIEKQDGFLSRFRRNDDDLRDFLTVLHKRLSASPYFTDLRWFTRAEYQGMTSDGAPAP